MKKFVKISLILFVLFSVFFLKSYGQTDTVNIRNSAVKVFIDCNSCDVEFIKRKIKFVNYVRDTKEAQVHILFTRQTAGNGGREYGFIFIGQKEFEGKNDTLKFTSQADNTSDEIRDRQVKYLTIGLLPYVSHTKLIDRLSVDYKNIEKENKEIVKDKWDNWVFSLSSNTWMNGESNYNEFNLWSNIRIQRITPEWKHIFRFSNSYSKSTYVIDETSKYVSINRSNSGSALSVKSINDHWSAGAKITAGSSTYNNYDFVLRVLPAVEYNIFPYDKSSVKQFTFLFESGYNYSDYTDTTIYNKVKENLIESQLSAAYKVNKKWGSINVSVSGSDYWHDLSKFNLDLYSSLNIRIVKGLSVRLSGGASLIRNQLSLKKAGASYEEILLRQQQVATNYNFWMSAGISYTFGSIYNNIVNPRFEGNTRYIIR